MRPRWLRIPTGCCTTAEVGVRLPRLSLRLTLGARQSTAATRCIQVRGEERVWSNRTLRRLSPSSSNMESKRSFWVASVVQLRAIAKRTVARRTEMSVDIPSATQAAEYVRHCCPLIMEALPRTTARPPAQHWCAPPIIACRGNFNLGCAALSPAVCARPTAPCDETRCNVSNVCGMYGR